MTDSCLFIVLLQLNYKASNASITSSHSLAQYLLAAVVLHCFKFIIQAQTDTTGFLLLIHVSETLACFSSLLCVTKICVYFFFDNVFESQSRPSYKPSPVGADGPGRNQGRGRYLLRPNLSATS